MEKIEIKNSLIKRFVVAAYTVSFMVFIVISILYYNQYKQIRDSKILAKSLELVIINTQAFQSLHALVDVLLKVPPDNISYNETANKLINNIRSQLTLMSPIEADISDRGHVDRLISHIDKIYFLNNSVSDIMYELKIIQTMMRKIQVSYTVENTSKIKSIIRYDNSFIITICCLAFIFIVATIFIVWKYTNRLKESMEALLTATNEINKQNYEYQAKIIGHDELSLVTSEFNKMTLLLGQHKKQLLEFVDDKNKLLLFSNLFSKALSEDELYDITFNQHFSDIGANTGAAYILNKTADTLILKNHSGITQENVNKWHDISSEDDLEIWDAIKLQKSIYLNDISKYASEYKKNIHIYFVPILVEARPIGVFFFTFVQDFPLSQNKMDFLNSLTLTCANNIYRTRLYDNAKKAILVRDDFMAMASHELLTPLTPLKIQFQRYKAKVTKNGIESITSEKMNALLTSSLNQIEQISTLVNDLLSVSNINNNKLIVNRSSFKLKEFINKVVIDYLDIDRQAIVINVICNIDEELEVKWDKLKIEQIIFNIFSNVIKYSNEKIVDVTVETDANCAFIKFRDYGPGIPASERIRVFKKFERLANKTTMRGMGLGLYISKEIAKLHDGDLTIIDTEGPGATFYLKLPI